MLAFARRQELRPEAVDLPSFGGRDGRDAAAVAWADDPHRDRHGYVQLPLIRVDPNQLELALLNLALNARDAMANGGQLLVQAHREHDGSIPPELTGPEPGANMCGLLSRIPAAEWMRLC